LLASFSFFAACGEPAEATLIVTETHALAACDGEEGCMQEPAPEQGGWVSRCTSNDECAIGECVCGVCTESCNGEPDACSGLPEGAACFAGRSLPRAALCHATTVPGICLMPCSSDEECGEGTVCALGACLPEPEQTSAN
jgi:hypothetical protein